MSLCFVLNVPNIMPPHLTCVPIPRSNSSGSSPLLIESPFNSGVRARFPTDRFATGGKSACLINADFFVDRFPFARGPELLLICVLYAWHTAYALIYSKDGSLSLPEVVFFVSCFFFLVLLELSVIFSEEPTLHPTMITPSRRPFVLYFKTFFSSCICRRSFSFPSRPPIFSLGTSLRFALRPKTSLSAFLAASPPPQGQCRSFFWVFPLQMSLVEVFFYKKYPFFFTFSGAAFEIRQYEELSALTLRLFFPNLSLIPMLSFSFPMLCLVSIRL